MKDQPSEKTKSNKKSSPQFTELVKAAQGGDRDALSRLIEATQDDVYRFCIYLTGEKNLAQDLTQDVFIKVVSHLKNLKEPEQFKSWLFQVAKNLFLDFIKSPKNQAVEQLTP